MKAGQLLSEEEEYYESLEEFGEESFTAMIGAEAIQFLLSNINLEEERLKVSTELKETGSEVKRRSL